MYMPCFAQSLCSSGALAMGRERLRRVSCFILLVHKNRKDSAKSFELCCYSRYRKRSGDFAAVDGQGKSNTKNIWKKSAAFDLSTLLNRQSMI